MKRALVAIGGGYGEVAAATPVVSALRSLDFEVDALVESASYQAATLLSGWDAVETIFLTRRSLRQREGTRKYAAVVRTISNAGGSLDMGREFRPEKRARKAWNEADMNLSALRRLGWQGERPACHVERDLPFQSLPERFAAIAPGCSRRDPEGARRLWPHWERFCDMIREHTEMEVVALGADEDSAKWMKSASRPWLHNLCGMTSIRGAAGVISQSEVLFAVDNGLGWVGAATGRPVVSVFGPTSFTSNGPVGERVAVVRSPVICAPCQFTRRWDRCADARCMAAIEPGAVLDAGLRVIKSPEPTYFIDAGELIAV